MAQSIRGLLNVLGGAASPQEALEEGLHTHELDVISLNCIQERHIRSLGRFPAGVTYPHTGQANQPHDCALFSDVARETASIHTHTHSHTGVHAIMNTAGLLEPKPPLPDSWQDISHQCTRVPRVSHCLS